MRNSELHFWLALSLLPGMSSLIFNQLIEHFGSPQHLLECSPSGLAEIKLKPAIKAAIQNYQQSSNSPVHHKVSKSLQWLSSDQKHYIISLHCQEYPPLLKEIPDPPPLLYINGDLSALARPQIAMVGSRNPGATGRRNAQSFARHIVSSGFSVCSGMALGVDYESHCGAIEEAGTTIAVMGTGIDQIYPRQNRALAHRIINNGALVSEFPLGAKPQPWHFPRRNRIISGLSQGVIVVEAALKSGSLITARFALEQGREVFAIPGSIHSNNTKGCHSLILDGAKLIESIDDVLEELQAFAPSLQLAENQISDAQVTAPELLASLTRDAVIVLAEIDYEPISIDNLIRLCNLVVSKVSVALIELEIKGLIQVGAGGYTLSLKENVRL